MHNTRYMNVRRFVLRNLCRMALALMLMGGGVSVAMAADAAPPAEGATGSNVTITQKNWLETLKQGGWVMYPILGFSVLTIWLSVDLWMRMSKKKLAPDAHVNAVKDLFRMGDYVGAYQQCKNNPSAFSDAVRSGLSFVGEGQHATEDAVITSLNRTNASITTRTNYLSVIGVCTPMVGLLGTTTGMVKAFESLGQAGIGDPSALSHAIGEVLVATASGLAIAIPAFMMFYVLRNRLQGSMTLVTETCMAIFRKMPYEDLADCHVGEEEFFAARPNWVNDEQPASAVPA